MSTIKKYNIGGYGSGWTNPNYGDYGHGQTWGSTTYGPNVAGTPLDQQYNTYVSQNAYNQVNAAEDWYDQEIANYYNTIPGQERTQTLNQLYSSGAQFGRDIYKLPKGNLGDKWSSYKDKFQLQPNMIPLDPPAGSMMSPSMQQTYSPEMVAEMTELGTAPTDLVSAPTEVQVGTTAPWSLAGQKAATWSMGTQVGQVGTAMAPYAAPVAMLGKGLQLMADDQKPETYTFQEGASGFVSGAGQGAMIGSMILPGIGTVAGAIIGGVVSIFRGKKKAKKYQEYLDDLDEYKEELAQFEDASDDYQKATTIYGSSPIMKKYYDKGGYTDYNKLPSYGMD